MNVMKAGKRYAAWTAGIVSLSMAFAMSGCASKYGPADAVTYVESVLDASYRAEFEEYMQLTDSTPEEAQAMYQQNIENVMSGVGIDSAGLSDELSGQYREIAPRLLALAKYEVTEVEREDNGFAVRVAIEPFEGYLGLEDDLVSALEEDAAGMTEMPDDLTVNEIVYQNMLEILQQKIDKPVYGDPEEYTIHVTEGDDRVYEIPKEELIELDYALFPAG